MGDQSQEELPRPERRRRRRAQEFLDAAQHIVFHEGFDGLTMSRLARELDTVDSAVYRYFPSKGALIAEIQRVSVERLVASLDGLLDRTAAALDARPAEEAALRRVVLVGRWFCACADSFPEEMRLFQMIMSRRAAALDPEEGDRLFPVTMGLLTRGVDVLGAAADAGALDAGSATDRAVQWAASMSGVLQTDDLERYAPDLFGGGRLARLVSLDLLAGWGADRAALTAADEWVDALAADGPLAA